MYAYNKIVQAQYYVDHREERKACRLAYYATHREEEKARGRVWYALHREQGKATSMAWEKGHPAQVGAWRTIHPEKLRLYAAKHKAKRRTLGFVPMNTYFEGCEAHHLDHDHIVYMPKALHRSIFHRQRDGQGMEKINALALQWLAQNQ